MPLSTEVFVMTIFIAGFPFFYIILRDSKMKGRISFLWAYIFLTLSNVFTVVEEFRWNTLFNSLEHLFITFGAIMLLVAVISLTTEKNHQRMNGPSEDKKGAP